MNVLLVEDEDGIREGLATWLRLKGHRVVTAASCADGVARLRAEACDVLVTDWRLGDGCGERLLEACSAPVIVMSGHPDEVPQRAGTTILVKPVLPAELLACLTARHAAPRAAKSPSALGTADATSAPPATDAPWVPRPTDAPSALRATDAPPHATEAPSAPDAVGSAPSLPPDLPLDTRDLVALTLALAAHGEAHLPPDAVQDDGAIVSIRLGGVTAALASDLARLGGDQRRLADGTLELRFFRDARPPGVHVVGPDERWPPGDGPLVIDVSQAPCSPRDVSALLDRVSAARAAGRSVALIHVPSHLRLWLEVSDRADDMPKRTRPGPVLSRERAELWSGA